MARAKKEYRELTVGDLGGYSAKHTPIIRMTGNWLEEAGFHAGDRILVKCEEGKLIVTIDNARIELEQKGEKLMKELQKKYELEKKKLRRKLVAEPDSRYNA